MAGPQSVSFRLSMLDTVKLVFASAVACACITPSFRLAQLGDARVIDMVLLDAFVVPLVLTLFSHAMVRRGPRRDTLIAALILISASVAFGALAWGTFPSIVQVARFGRYGPAFVRPFDFPLLGLAIIGGPPLAGLIVYLLNKLTRGRRR